MFVYVCFQVQELGLQRAYSEDDAVYKYIRKLMALPFLPHHQISPMFLRLQVEAQTEPLQNLVAYIRRQWIESAVFLPKTGSCTSRPSERTTTSKDGTMLRIVVRAGSVDHFCYSLLNSNIVYMGIQFLPIAFLYLLYFNLYVFFLLYIGKKLY